LSQPPPSIETVWLDLAPVLFGFGQFPMHWIFANIKLKSLYNLGLAAVVLGPHSAGHLVSFRSQDQWLGLDLRPDLPHRLHGYRHDVA
jgi:hypothetical protein